MSLNRTVEPVIEIPEKIFIKKVEKFILDNGIPCYFIHSPDQDVLKIEINIEAGAIVEQGRLIAAATNDLSDDGTMRKTAKEIAEHVDFYGASIQMECGPDRASVTLFTLGKFLHETLPVLQEILIEPVFPEDELKTYKVQHQQRLSVNNRKVEFVARKMFGEILFGSSHPYGYYATEKDYDQLQREELIRFHREAYHPANCTLIVSGNATEKVKSALNLALGKESGPGKKNETADATFEPVITSPVYSEKAGALQSAIRIGRRLFNKTHPDFIGMSILNTILGGYFGSRLMSNIREDKGYTYGIGSALVSLQHAGYFFIATEVGTAVTNETLHEIYKEIARLQNEPVGNEELITVKNYLAGAFLRSIDGPFALTDKWKGIHFYGLDYGYYDKYLEILHEITGNDLQLLASKYLNKNDLNQVVVGKK